VIYPIIPGHLMHRNRAPTLEKKRKPDLVKNAEKKTQKKPDREAKNQKKTNPEKLTSTTQNMSDIINIRLRVLHYHIANKMSNKLILGNKLQACNAIVE